MLQRIQQVTQLALQGGQLRRIETCSTWREDRGMSFLIRQVSSLVHKPHVRQDDPPPAVNPFLPYDPAMFVADVAPAHVALLNKFPVVADHLLIITRRFEPQWTRLTLGDFQALAACQSTFPSLGFYNSGSTAGASQPHRHLQLIPLPMAEGGPALPLETLLFGTGQTAPARPATSPVVPFGHRWQAIEAVADPLEQGRRLADAYDALIASLGWQTISRDQPYNLLVRPHWMMLVPRRAEAFAGISLNAMAFAGALLVRTLPELERLCDAGPMQALVHTAALVPTVPDEN